MRFKAIKLGFMGSRLRPGDEFDAPEGFKASWAEPVDESAVEVSAEPEGKVGGEVPDEPDAPDRPKRRKKVVHEEKG